MGYSKIKYDLVDGVARVTMSDPAALNAVDTPMILELTEAVERAAREARCLLLTGDGRAFCSGANLSSVGELGEDGRIDVGLVLEKYYNHFVSCLRDLPIPFVTAVNGAAAGVGASFALLGDIIVAGESAYFLQAFRRIGLVPDGGATYLLPRMTSRARAMELMLLGDKLPAPKALDWGLINRCVPDADLLAAAQAIAADLAQGPTRSLAMIRRLTWQALDSDWTAQLQAERWAQRDAGYTADFAEGVAAFMEKRPANFKGE